MDRTTYGLDIAKSVMQLHWVDGESGEIGKKKLARGKLADYFARLQPVRVVMEACGSAHHWARVLGVLGHQVELLPAREVRPFVRNNKDDAADARAIWLAAQQTDIRRVPKKSVEQQAVLALHRTRSHWVSVRSATSTPCAGCRTSSASCCRAQACGAEGTRGASRRDRRQCSRDDAPAH
jgi:transposase